MRRLLVSWLVVGIAATACALAAWQWPVLEAGRHELAGLREQARELPRLRQAHAALKAGHVSSAELAALRVEHQAVLRLRAELEKLQRTPTGP